MKYYFAFLSLFAALFIVVYLLLPNNEQEKNITKNKEEQPELEQVEIEEIDSELENELLTIAKDFVQAYGNYDVNSSMAYIEAMKPYVVDKIYEQHTTSPKREPINILKYTILEDESSFSVVKETVSEIEEVKTRYTVIGEVVRNTQTTERTYPEDIQFTLELKLINEKWLVNEVKIEDGKQYQSITESSELRE